LVISYILVPFVIANELENADSAISIFDLGVTIILVIDIILSFFMDNYSEAGHVLTFK
jgi:hypothetical protein